MNEKTNALTESCINKFHELANLFREHMYETAKSYCLKHVAHVFGAGQTINEEKITESLGDIAVYCIIMQHMVESNKQAAEK